MTAETKGLGLTPQLGLLTVAMPDGATRSYQAWFRLSYPGTVQKRNAYGKNWSDLCLLEDVQEFRVADELVKS